MKNSTKKFLGVLSIILGAFSLLAMIAGIVVLTLGFGFGLILLPLALYIGVPLIVGGLVFALTFFGLSSLLLVGLHPNIGKPPTDYLKIWVTAPPDNKGGEDLVPPPIEEMEKYKKRKNTAQRTDAKDVVNEPVQTTKVEPPNAPTAPPVGVPVAPVVEKNPDEVPKSEVRGQKNVGGDLGKPPPIKEMENNGVVAVPKVVVQPAPVVEVQQVIQPVEKKDDALQVILKQGLEKKQAIKDEQTNVGADKKDEEMLKKQKEEQEKHKRELEEIERKKEEKNAELEKQRLEKLRLRDQERKATEDKAEKERQKLVEQGKLEEKTNVSLEKLAEIERQKLMDSKSEYKPTGVTWEGEKKEGVNTKTQEDLKKETEEAAALIKKQLKKNKEERKKKTPPPRPWTKPGQGKGDQPKQGGSFSNITGELGGLGEKLESGGEESRGNQSIYNAPLGGTQIRANKVVTNLVVGVKEGNKPFEKNLEKFGDKKTEPVINPDSSQSNVLKQENPDAEEAKRLDLENKKKEEEINKLLIEFTGNPSDADAKKTSEFGK